MIFIGLGANLPAAGYATPRATLDAALAKLGARGVSIGQVSPWYRSAPVPASNQPWFVNAVARLETTLEPEALLDLLHEIEAEFGRRRLVLNEARPIDLDLLDYAQRVSNADARPRLPHPRLQDRAFVLLPLADLAPNWRHPVTKLSVNELILRLPADQEIVVMAPVDNK